jgi:hypothetical protein
MKILFLRVLAILVVGHILAPLRAVEGEKSPGIDWQPWSDAVFARAKAEKKLVLLDVGAVWCHWCHVMDEITYRDPAVLALLREHYIAVRVDQDARPDISNRYGGLGVAGDGGIRCERQGTGETAGVSAAKTDGGNVASVCR